MILFIRFIFAFLGLCALVFAWNFAMTFSQMLIANNISSLLFTSLLFSVTSVAASMVAFYAMRNAPKLKSKQRLVYVIAYVIIMLPSIMILMAMNQLAAS